MMKMIRMISLLISFVFTTTTFAQDFKYESKIEQVNDAGYYKIALSPELLGKVKLNGADLRIIDQEGREVPYFISQEDENTKSSNFNTYEVVDRIVIEDSSSAIIFHNVDKRNISNITFVVKNTDVRKRATLSGSNDKENWFLIKENYILHSMNSVTETSEFKMLNFPLSDYEFFKLEMVDKNQLPINILKVGFYDTEYSKGSKTQFNLPIIYVLDSVKSTFLQVSLDNPVYLEELKFTINSPEFYSRSAEVSIREQRVNRQKKIVNSYRTIGQIILNSNSQNVLSLSPVITDSLYIKIVNGDDAPLDIESIEARFLTKYAIAELNPQNTYVFKFGDEEKSLPSYDLRKFERKIQLQKLIISHLGITTLVPEEHVEESPSIFENPLIVWSVLGLVGLLLGFISFKMIKEMN